MQKKQKKNTKNKNSRAYKSFINIVKCWKDDCIFMSHISNIYESTTTNNTNANVNYKHEVELCKLPLWRDITDTQKQAYFMYFMAETHEYANLKPFTLDFSREFRAKHKSLTYKELKAVIIKRMYGNLDYQLQSMPKPMMSFTLENKVKCRRKDINDKETHIHGIREVFDDNDIDCKVILSLKTSVCDGHKEYKQPEYRNMLNTRDGYSNYKHGAAGWMRYMNKGTCSNNGLYISASLLEKIRDDYNQLYARYSQYINELKVLGVKVRFKNVK